jgi:hypothetical protein
MRQTGCFIPLVGAITCLRHDAEGSHGDTRARKLNRTQRVR